MSKEKICIKCGEFGPHYNDYTSGYRDNIKPYYKKCHAKSQIGRNPEIARRSHYKSRYGITVDAYNEILELQGGVCWICKGEDTRDTRLSVDHCHTSKEVRGLLCKACNSGLGQFKDDIERLERAIKYLSRFPNV